jgi:hypothetical protein
MSQIPSDDQNLVYVKTSLYMPRVVVLKGIWDINIPALKKCCRIPTSLVLLDGFGFSALGVAAPLLIEAVFRLEAHSDPSRGPIRWGLGVAFAVVAVVCLILSRARHREFSSSLAQALANLLGGVLSPECQQQQRSDS